MKSHFNYSKLWSYNRQPGRRREKVNWETLSIVRKYYSNISDICVAYFRMMERVYIILNQVNFTSIWSDKICCFLSPRRQLQIATPLLANWNNIYIYI